MTYLIHGTQEVKKTQEKEDMEQEIRLHMSRRLHSLNGQYMGGCLC